MGTGSQSEKGVVKMGPAPLQPDRFYIGKQPFRCNGACPTFTTVFKRVEHGASPHFSLEFSVCVCYMGRIRSHRHKGT